MEEITFGSDTTNPLSGFVCGKVEPGSTGIVVLQAWWGVTPIIKSHAEKLAENGYRCLIPDLYHGKSTVDKEEARHLFYDLDWPGAVQECCQAIEYLRGEGCSKVVAFGSCMGGALALAAGQHCNLDGAVSFYGTPSRRLAQPEHVKIPVQIHVGELDKHVGFSDLATVDRWISDLHSAGGSGVMYVYEACGHAFLNSGDLAVELRKNIGHPEPTKAVQELAWERALEFIRSI
jgi:carboxymethylenebutenolidase